ncbi:MAG: hypothetical protein QM727_03565 [Niabella sp.]
MKNRIFTIILISTIALFTQSCSLVKRMNKAKGTAEQSRTLVAKETESLGFVMKKTTEKIAGDGLDSSMSNSYIQTLNQLSKHLTTVEEAAIAVQQASQNPKNFVGKNYYNSSVFRNIGLLDSFNREQQTRARMYKLIDESISLNTLKLFNFAAFFDPGVFKVPESAVGAIEKYFASIIDSVAELSNKYADIPHTAKFVLVGYADAAAIAPGSVLYKQLSDILQHPEPSREELNRVLSDLRARELLHSLGIVVNKNLSKFNNDSKLKVVYVGYGRGEAYPSKTITDYKSIDDRRRIVLCYWAILPTVE